MGQVSITGLEDGFSFFIFGQHIVIMRALLYMSFALFALLLFAFFLRYLTAKQDIKAKPHPVLIVTETFWKFSGGNLATIKQNKYYDFLHVFAANLFIFLFLINMMGIFGVSPPAASLIFALGLGIFIALFVHGLGLAGGMKQYLVAYMNPMVFFLPLNIVEIFSQVISISMRLFGNMLAGVILSELIKSALTVALPSVVTGLPIAYLFGQVFYIFVGSALSLYSDFFIAAIQSLIFMSLSISYIKGKIAYANG